jgi:hypothetical protein
VSDETIRKPAHGRIMLRGESYSWRWDGDGVFLLEAAAGHPMPSEINDLVNKIPATIWERHAEFYRRELWLPAELPKAA